MGNRSWRNAWLFALAAQLPLALGCGGAAPPAEEVPAKAEAPEPVKKVPDSKLRPLVADLALPAVDNGRLEIYPPQGWTSSTGSLDILIWFKRERSTAKLPRILLKADDVTADMPSSTEENVNEFKAWAHRYLTGKDENFAPKLLEPLKAMMIGDKACVRYVQKATDPDGRPAERQVLLVLHEGRLYSVNLDVEPKEITDFRDDAYALLAAMKFVAPAAASAAPAPKK